MYITKELMTFIKERHRLPLNGCHGVSHWARVYWIGNQIARCYPEADTKVISLFAFLHDLERHSDCGSDTEHGPRAAETIQEINGSLINLDDKQLFEITEACNHHSFGPTDHESISVKICWDADRLDLGRVGIIPHPDYLCTEAAKSPSFLFECYQRSIGNYTNKR